MTDDAPLTLTGYHLSVYTRAARMALAAKGLRHGYEERYPFDPAQAELLRRAHPFGRVPVLEHGRLRLYETQAILDYIDAAFSGPSLVPGSAASRAQMRQVMGIVDNYLYWPLVRQAFSHAVFRPRMGEVADRAQVAAGLAAAPRVLDALEEIAGEGRVLATGRRCLAGCLLWPMLDYFRMVPEGAAMLAARPVLHTWAGWIADSPEALATQPRLPEGETT